MGIMVFRWYFIFVGFLDQLFYKWIFKFEKFFSDEIVDNLRIPRIRYETSNKINDQNQQIKVNFRKFDDFHKFLHDKVRHLNHVG
jgi:hypothetical protein